MGEAEPVSRGQKMEQSGVTPRLPPNPAPHLIGYLMEIGPVEFGAMDATPISWASIWFWQQQTQVDLTPWEARLIRRLSSDYVDQMRKSRDPQCPAPWGERTEAEREVVSAKIRSIFGGLARNKAQA